MDQQRIGKFIALLRKEKKLTQSNLAEKLGVSDRSVSNWENGKCMPDLSLFKPLCKEFDISINELLSGEKLDEEDYREKLEENIVNTIDYTNKKMNHKRNVFGIVVLVFGFLNTLTAIAIFPSESSWSSIYSIFGTLIALAGFLILTRPLEYAKKVFLNFGFLLSFILFLFYIDYVNVKLNHQAPRFSKETIMINSTVLYDTPFYDVYRCFKDTNHEYWVIEKNKIYTTESILNYCK